MRLTRQNGSDDVEPDADLLALVQANLCSEMYVLIHLDGKVLNRRSSRDVEGTDRFI